MSDIPPYRPDPLADGFRTPPIRPAGGPAEAPPPPTWGPAPDPRTDRHVSFPDDQPPRESGRSTLAAASGSSTSQPAPPAHQRGPGGKGPGGKRPGGKRPGGPIRLVAFAALVFAGLATFGSFDLDDLESSPDEPESEQVPTISALPLPPPDNEVEAPTTATRIRLEVLGPAERSPTLRLYQGSDKQQNDAIDLPFAAELDVTGLGYVGLSVNDYETREAGPMQCRIYLDEVLVSMETGHTSLSCTVNTRHFAASDEELG